MKNELIKDELVTLMKSKPEKVNDCKKEKTERLSKIVPAKVLSNEAEAVKVDG